ncbi:MAG: protoheme farnesyltransferase [Hyphomicrobiales bacterium]|nr:protoheme farnesyltransferase [Hyphomicrobiales bacterium]
MSFVSQHDSLTDAPARISVADPKDYLALLKPRVMSLVVFTALAGLLVAPGNLHPLIACVSLLAIAVGAGASGALNMWYDADIDAVMARTRTRPVPSGRISPEEALGFGLTLSIFSVLTLGLVANWLAASLLAFTIFFYAVVYTMWLKRSTPQNIVIGGAAGALPPIVAYAAATNSVSLSSVVLFAIIFIWTPPHFWALALVKSADYARAGIPMMPNVKGPAHTRLEIVLYTILLVPVGVLPWFMGFASLVYGIVAAISGLGMLALALRVYRVREGAIAERAAMQLFAYSIFYLFLLFAVIVVENGFGSAIRHFG